MSLGRAIMLEAARQWLERGYLVVPVPFRSKRPIIRAWQHLRLHPDALPQYFNGTRQNLGVLLGEPNGNCDIDLDQPEALITWPKFAPQTRLVFGRRSKPASHWFYRVDPPIPSQPYVDPINHATIMELRCLKENVAVGKQTVVPPSVHKDSGEEIRFEQGMDEMAAKIDAQSLQFAVAQAAAAALLARHWPAAGQGRHNCELAIAGVLARSDWLLGDALVFVLATYQAVPDHDRNAIGRVSKSVKDTFEKRAAGGGATTGIPTLADLIDKKVVSTALRWLGIDQGPRTSGHTQPSWPEPSGAELGVDGDSLPQINVNGRELRDVSAEVLQALSAANHPPKLFARAGSLVRVDRAQDGRSAITAVTDVHLRGEMTRSANFFKIGRRGHESAAIAVNPPLDVARDLLSRPLHELNLPPLDTISESPFIRLDGNVVCRPGYDPITRTFYAPCGELDDFIVPDRPTVADVDGARKFIEEVFVDFPFADRASRANALALFITPELRPAIVGNVPAALVDAPQAGSGKSLLAEVVAIKSTGTSAAMKPAPVRDEEEWRKTLTATIQAGQSMAVFDNVDSILGSWRCSTTWIVFLEAHTLRSP